MSRAVGSAAVPAKPRSPKGRARLTQERLIEEYPEARCELDHETPFQLLVATILSAQCTDARVNLVTPALFRRFPSPAELASAQVDELEALIRPTGFFRNKAKSLMGMAQALIERYDAVVPGPMEELVTVPGVGRKTANVVRSVALGLPGLPVDTHVPPLNKWCLPSKVGREKSSYAGCTLYPGSWSISLSVHCHAFPITSKKPPGNSNLSTGHEDA